MFRLSSGSLEGTGVSEKEFYSRLRAQDTSSDESLSSMTDEWIVTTTWEGILDAYEESLT